MNDGGDEVAFHAFTDFVPSTCPGGAYDEGETRARALLLVV
eukprot:CAMPEP_0172513864 /NCGR_PEP_ID=MMETSP1066-20121228/256088_1 /TAXON_ID=671091 /ORGANISM="Coscinodiscus wailesii, Strain CCMP2513" /LENGTH=40 /DNA_ID= /DNA_START= /DNA_END= /DNA_ORIENTATION=